MSNPTCSQSVDDPILDHPLDGRFQVHSILTTQFCRRIYLAQDLHQRGQPECLVYHLQGIPQSAQYEEAIRGLLLREVNLLAELGNHPQIPAIVTCFEDQAGFYVVQEKIPGLPLSQELKIGRCWSAEWVIEFLLSVLELLSFVQRQGCVHGNLTPNAVLQQDNGQICLTDFGNLLQIQESLIAATGLPVPYSDAAQQGYQPLEQLQGLPCPASDVYAVGMMGIQALTGLRPIQLKVDLEAKQLLWHSQYQAESELEQKLVEILDCMVHWDLTQRYGSAAEALSALESIDSFSTFKAPIAQSSVLTIAANVAQESTILAPDQPIVPYVAEPEPLVLTWDARPDYQLNVPYPEPDLEAWRSPTTHQPPEYLVPTEARTEPAPLPPRLEPDYASSQERAYFSSRESAYPSSQEPDYSSHQERAYPSNPQGAYPLSQEPDYSNQEPDSLSQPRRPSLLSRPTVLVGAGGTVATLGLAAVGWSLLASGGGLTTKVNGIWERLSKAQNANPEVDQAASTGSEQWRKNWQAGAETYRQAEAAFNLGKWVEASKLSQRMPPIPYWQDRGATLSKLAIARVETDANQLLQSAYTYALDRNFTAALKELNQVPQETSVADVAQTKIKEYSEKQMIRAWFDLQRAYDRAAVQDFTQALTYLWQIPVGTPPYETAREKIAEYTQKQEQYIKSLTQAANDQAQQGDFRAALLTLDKVPKGTALDDEVGAIAAQYTEQLNQQANQQLQQATVQADIGDKTATVATLEKIPMGTAAYAQARDKIAEYTGNQSAPIAEAVPQQTIAARDLNPGNQLREPI